MLFNSLKFLIFFPLVVLGYFLIPDRWKHYWLLLASYYFYMSWNAGYALLILFSTGVTYICARLLEKEKTRAEEELAAAEEALKHSLNMPTRQLHR